MLCLSLYLALDGANSPPGVHCGNSPRHGSGSGAHKRWIHWLLSASWPARTLPACEPQNRRSEEHTSELQSLMRLSYAGFCLKKKKMNNTFFPTKTIKQVTYKERKRSTKTYMHYCS